MSEKKDAYDLFLECATLNGIGDNAILNAGIDLVLSTMLTYGKSVQEVQHFLDISLDHYKINHHKVYGEKVFEKI
jgi:hypothetical protein